MEEGETEPAEEEARRAGRSRPAGAGELASQEEAERARRHSTEKREERRDPTGRGQGWLVPVLPLLLLLLLPQHLRDFSLSYGLCWHRC